MRMLAKADASALRKKKQFWKICNLLITNAEDATLSLLTGFLFHVHWLALLANFFYHLHLKPVWRLQFTWIVPLDLLDWALSRIDSVFFLLRPLNSCFPETTTKNITKKLFQHSDLTMKIMNVSFFAVYILIVKLIFAHWCHKWRICRESRYVIVFIETK